MTADPRDEQCPGCGRELDECLCGLAPDLTPLTKVNDPDSDLYMEHWDED